MDTLYGPTSLPVQRAIYLDFFSGNVHIKMWQPTTLYLITQSCLNIIPIEAHDKKERMAIVFDGSGTRVGTGTFLRKISYALLSQSSLHPIVFSQLGGTYLLSAH